MSADEHAIIDRLAHNLGEASDAANAMAKFATPERLTTIVKSLGQAAGCCGQLVHHQQNPQWIGVRDNLEQMSGLCIRLSPETDREVWARMRDTMLAVRVLAQKIARAKPVSRQDALMMIEKEYLPRA